MLDLVREKVHFAHLLPFTSVSRSENLKVSLCPAGCGACPDVEIVGEEVRIGELGDLAVLKKGEWNLLVDLIESGQLKKI